MADLTQILKWPGGAGWLVLSAGASDESLMDEIRATALTRITIDGGVAYVGLDEDDHEYLIEDMADMGAPTGYFVNVLTEDDATIRELLEEAGMILIPDDVDPAQLRSALMGAALEGIQSAYARGAVILAEGEAARLFGVRVSDAVEGFNWVENAYVAPKVVSITEAPHVRGILSRGEADIAIGLGSGSALVLGPERRVETWGEGKVTIALGGRLQGS